MKRSYIILIALLFALLSNKGNAQKSFGPELLVNPTLSGPFRPLPLVKEAASISGNMPKGWIIKTTPGDLSAVISNVTVNGKPAVKISITRLASGSLMFGQEVQNLRLAHEYMFDIHVSGNGETPVTTGVWGNNDPTDNSEMNVAPSESLSQSTVVFTVDEKGPTFCFVQFKSVGTFYISGASVTGSKSFPPG